MAEKTSNKHFETEFEFPLFVLIKERARKKDISYHDAALEVIPEYVKTIRYGDEKFENALMEKDSKESKAALKEWEKLMQKPIKGDR